MRKILVVEDDPDIQEILKNHLTDAGYEVVLAEDGVAGISKFDDTIHLVLLDLMLPKIDGFGVCQVIRQRSQVPIVMLTALSDEENQGKVFTRQMLLNRLWDGDAFVEERIVESHIKNIRKKLDGAYIQTIRGVGYRIDKEH